MPIRKTVAVVIACGLLALGMLFSVRGIGEIRRTKADLRSFADEIRVSGDVVVTDQWWLPAALAPTFVEREIYTIPAGGSLAAWVGHVGRLSKRFLFVSYDGAPADEEAIQALGVRLSGSKLLNGMHFLRYEAVRP
jgi:hypothetical protein